MIASCLFSRADIYRLVFRWCHARVGINLLRLIESNCFQSILLSHNPALCLITNNGLFTKRTNKLTRHTSPSWSALTSSALYGLSRSVILMVKNDQFFNLTNVKNMGLPASVGESLPETLNADAKGQWHSNIKFLLHILFNIDRRILKSKVLERVGNTKNGYASQPGMFSLPYPSEPRPQVSRRCRDWHWDWVWTHSWTWIQNTRCVLSFLHFRTFQACLVGDNMQRPLRY